jgi:ABC-type Fe3+/spermidine/putrescine transport system ATPase subunit
MSAGRVEQIGTVDEIYYKPASRFVATFIGETNIVEAEVLGSRAGLLHCRIEGGLELDVKVEAISGAGKLLLSLRPEKIRLYRTSPGGANTFPGRIAVEIFKGAVDDLTVIVAGGLELQALLANDGQQEFDFHEGEEVFCRIQPEDINLVSS